MPLKVPAAVQNVVDHWMSCVPLDNTAGTQSTINVGRPALADFALVLRIPMSVPVWMRLFVAAMAKRIQIDVVQV